MATRRILQKRAVVVMNAGQKMQTARDVAYAVSMIQQNAHVVQSATPVRKVVESALNAMSMMNVLAKILSND
jgi:ABC-type phosphate/phosphonate transport system ATPase subunit